MTIPVDSSIPIPTDSTSTGPKGRYVPRRNHPKLPLEQLKPGDSFFVPEAEGPSKSKRTGWIRERLRRFRNYNPTIQLFMAISIENEIRGRRIWRTA